jgi:hypothetical protein
MPLPKKTLRVLPNPWGHIHPDHGPQARCPVDNGGRGGEQLFVGAEWDTERSEPARDIKPGETSGRGARGVIRSSEEPVTVARSPYYLDRLRDGDLVPADDETLQVVGELACRFKNIAEARAAGIARFEAEFGIGSFAEAFPELAKELAPAAPPADQAAPAAAKSSKSKPNDAGASS